MPPAEHALVLAPSRIAGRGVFTVAPLPAGERLGCDLALLNHSCDPNLGWLDAGTLTVLRDVAAGSELTLDYATFQDDPAFTLFCHCETYRCRQVVEGTDWRIPQLQTRYAGRWHPAVARLIAAGG